MGIFGQKKPKAERGQAPDYPKIEGMNYLDVLSGIEAKLSAKCYLEIGSRTGAALIPRNCSFVAIDPEFQLRSADFASRGNMHFFRMTSDAFFAEGHLQRMGLIPDFAFIDGMHLIEYALRDFINCEKSMQPGGVICLHDTCPFNGEMTTRNVSYLDTGKAWTGDIWKIVPILRRYRPDLSVSVLSARRTGLCCVTQLDPQNDTLTRNYDEILAEFIDKDLAQLGPEYFYGSVELLHPKVFLDRLAT
jgi:hypothetical protein